MPNWNGMPDASEKPSAAGLPLSGTGTMTSALAGVSSARAVIVTLPDTHASVLVIEQVRNLASNIQIIARARYNIHVGLLEDAGADMIVNEEDRVGDAMGVIAIEGLENTTAESL